MRLRISLFCFLCLMSFSIVHLAMATCDTDENEDLQCDCIEACQPYADEEYDDCMNFCANNQEPIPSCMCDSRYISSKNRSLLAFIATAVSAIQLNRYIAVMFTIII